MLDWVWRLFFFNASAPTEIYTLSLHDALPIWVFSPRDKTKLTERFAHLRHAVSQLRGADVFGTRRDRKSTRLNSSHEWISYAVFCLKKKKQIARTEQGTASRTAATH